MKINNIKKARLSKLTPLLDLGVLGNGVFVAGGSMRTLIVDEEVCDFDMFFESGQLVDDVRDKLEVAGYELVFECPEGKLFTYAFIKDDGSKIKVQLILETMGSPESVIDTFDFTACCAAYDGTTLFLNPRFVRDVKKKSLELHTLTFPVATLKRMIKYSNKGYNVNEAARSIVDTIQTVLLGGGFFDDDDLRVYID